MAQVRETVTRSPEPCPKDSGSGGEGVGVAVGSGSLNDVDVDFSWRLRFGGRQDSRLERQRVGYRDGGGNTRSKSNLPYLRKKLPFLYVLILNQSKR